MRRKRRRFDSGASVCASLPVFASLRGSITDRPFGEMLACVTRRLIPGAKVAPTGIRHELILALARWPGVAALIRMIGIPWCDPLLELDHLEAPWLRLLSFGLRLDVRCLVFTWFHVDFSVEMHVGLRVRNSSCTARRPSAGI